MIDLINLPSNVDIKEYFGRGLLGTANHTLYTWMKPRGAKMVYIFAVGGGGGGGNGRTGSAGTARGGGGGGASGGVVSFLAPAILLPDYIQVHVGSGGTAASAGGATILSLRNGYISGTTSARYFSTTGGAAGVSSTGSGGGAGGSGASPGASIPADVAIFDASTGVDGAAGGASSANGGSITGFVSNIVHGGCGGAGTDAANTTRSGGSFTGNSAMPNITGGTSAGQVGGSGIILWKPFCSSPGAGGASNGTGTGGNGGDGGIGSGGGGGGAGTTGGTGGNGGPGYCLIVSIF